MRQAGRSLPEYRELRGDGSILDAIKVPELAAEITLQPVRRYGVDAAILFSDIVVPAAAVGFGVEIAPGVGPVCEQRFERAADLARLPVLEPEEHAPYVAATARLVAAEIDVPLIGFAGAPFTVASYLIEGRPSRTLERTKAMMVGEPVLFGRLLERLGESAAASLRSQVTAGASAVQLFDTWAGMLSPTDYETHVAPHSRAVFDAVTDLADAGVARAHFGVGTGELLGAMARVGAEVVGVDWRVPLDVAAGRVAAALAKEGNGRPVALQGNLDPALVLAGWPAVRPSVEAVLAAGAGANGHVFNLGHGVLPSTDPGVLAEVVDYVHSWRPNQVAAS